MEPKKQTFYCGCVANLILIIGPMLTMRQWTKNLYYFEQSMQLPLVGIGLNQYADM